MPVVAVCTFPPVAALLGPAEPLLIDALTYHRTYHHSRALHYNHLLFLHTYLFGTFLLLAAAGQLVVAAGSLVYASYTLLLTRAALPSMLTYCAFLLALAGIAWHVSLRCGGPASTVAWTATGIIIGSFACQLVGHAWHEAFVAPPALAHGFLAAPPLEVLVLMERLGVQPTLHGAVLRRVRELRTEAFRQLERVKECQ